MVERKVVVPAEGVRFPSIALYDDCILVVPKNSGLKKYKDIALSYIKNKNKIIEVRGEDVAFWVQEFQKQNKKAIGLIGEDLYKEYCLKKRDVKLEIIKRITWNDSKALFKKPALCLLGSNKTNLEKLPKKLTVCIAAKYKNLAKKYLNFLERKGFVFQKIYVNGCVELSCSEGIADLVIDIVYSGKSMETYGLKVYDKIIESDFLIIGGKNENR